MRQIVKRVKNGQEIKFICSKCENVVHSVFVFDGGKFEINWDKIPEKCSCGIRLINRQPIIDADNLDADNLDADNLDAGNLDAGNLDVDSMSGNIRGDIHRNVCNNVRKDTRKIVYRDISGNSDIYRRCIIDLENAVSIDYFDMRLNGLKMGTYKIPDNIDHLRTECIKRNISYIESCMERFSYDEDECGKSELKEKLDMLRQIYSDISKKSEDKKDFEKKRCS